MLDEEINRCICGGQADWRFDGDDAGNGIAIVQCKRCELQIRKRTHDLNYKIKKSALIGEAIRAWNHSMQKSKK